MSVFTVTEKETWDRCGWRHEFNSLNRMGIEPVIPLPALFIGTLVHTALDVLSSTLLIQEKHTYIPSTLPPIHKQDTPPCSHMYSKSGEICGLPYISHTTGSTMYDVYAAERFMKVQEHYTNIVGSPPDPRELKSLGDSIRLGQSMFNNYLSYYKEPLPKDWKYIATEQSVIVDIPNTSHCACSLQDSCTCRPNSQWPCRTPQMVYTHCGCKNKPCSCRVNHQLEGTIDGLVQHETTGWLYILENKTFTYHPTYDPYNKVYPEFQRNHQFMGYTWLSHALGLDTHGILYNGLWKKEEVPNKRTWDDMFLRTPVNYQSYEIEEWGRQAAIKALQMGDPTYIPTRTVPPVGGCKGLLGCSFVELCDARFKNVNYQHLLRTKYTKRERTSIFEEPGVIE